MKSLFILLASTAAASAGGLVDERFNTTPAPVANVCQHVPWTECGVVREDGPGPFQRPVTPTTPTQPPIVVEKPPVVTKPEHPPGATCGVKCAN